MPYIGLDDGLGPASIRIPLKSQSWLYLHHKVVWCFFSVISGITRPACQASTGYRNEFQQAKCIPSAHHN